ncbi:hypothetical protein CHU93_12210 [Sandarakinorhabdus cyanobacteriorum]|uniref:Response regulatory domain-containing protein n=1 Tax=Sandarakinorhabdus cyanobacteriorum TaxID=1981098 RepID=A0A255YAI3_9SPHN|nr:response regulator [Sandarakinorhabdus cyanobacteriorum]OYQ26153.1 hypothetical protein CHU93_12210 [Sandarakinorhabdus cyanobacteriorum]
MAAPVRPEAIGVTPGSRSQPRPEPAATDTRFPDPEGGSRQPLTVLVVDGDPAYRRNIVEQLQGQGHIVSAFSNCTDAWTALQSTRFDAAIVDLETPAITALELARRIDGMAGGPRLIATSPNLTRHSRMGRALCRDNGFRDVISKDAGRRNFNYKLKASLRRRGQPHDSDDDNPNPPATE